MKIVVILLGIIALMLSIKGVSLMQNAKDMIELGMGFIAISEGLCLIVVMRAIERNRKRIIDLFE
jgi:hypothetical protein